jgi:hypothetical protein
MHAAIALDNQDSLAFAAFGYGTLQTLGDAVPTNNTGVLPSDRDNWELIVVGDQILYHRAERELCAPSSALLFEVLIWLLILVIPFLDVW